MCQLTSLQAKLTSKTMLRVSLCVRSQFWVYKNVSAERWIEVQKLS